MQKLPATITISGQEDADELIKHSAKWHKSCRLKFSKYKLLCSKEPFKQNIEDRCPVERKSRRISSNVLPKTYVFCKKSDSTLHSCSAFNVDANLRSTATKMQDSDLLTCISGGDLVAIEAMYQSKCLLRYKHRFRAFGLKNDNTTEAMVYAELIDYVESGVKEGIFIYKLSELHLLFEDRMRILGSEKKINKSRLKTKLIDTFVRSNLTENMYFWFSMMVYGVFGKKLQFLDFDSEAVAITRVCIPSEKKYLKKTSLAFLVFFPKIVKKCPCRRVSSLVCLLLYGPNIKNKNLLYSHACLSICQLILFNSKERSARLNLGNFQKHFKSREPPLPLYLALKIHTQTRSKKLLTQLNDLGLSVSYNRLTEIQEGITSAL